MSANNFLLIVKTKKGKFILTEREADDGGKLAGEDWPEFDTLEGAVKAANEFQKEQEVEYGLDIRI